MAEKCRERAEQCRLNARTARRDFDEAAWLDLAADWMKLADAFEHQDDPKWEN
jgi:hypothetical protein